MKRMIAPAVLIVTAVARAAAPTASGEAPDLAWLAGGWCGEQDGTLSEEQWLAPRAGLMLGMHRDTRAGRAIFFEFLRIELRAGGATYLAQPAGRHPPTAFELREARDRFVEFVNERHDYPRRIRYHRSGASRLDVRVDDGTDAGKAEEWTWTRC